MPPFLEPYERSEQALDASLLASSSEYIPGDSYLRLSGFLCVSKRNIKEILDTRGDTKDLTKLCRENVLENQLSHEVTIFNTRSPAMQILVYEMRISCFVTLHQICTDTVLIDTIIVDQSLFSFK